MRIRRSGLRHWIAEHSLPAGIVLCTVSLALRQHAYLYYAFLLPGGALLVASFLNAVV